MAPATAPASATPNEMFQLLQMHELVPSETNPRKHFHRQTLEELAQSIREHGVVAPLVVRPLLPGATFEIIDGERRYRAAQIAGAAHVPARIVEMSDADVLEVQLIANIQRDDLDPLEEAKGYKALITSNPSKYSAAYIADRIGRSEKFVWDRMKLLDLIPEIAQLLDQERILVGHADLLARLKPEDQQRAIDPGNAQTFGRAGDSGGLWTDIGRTLEFALDDEDKHHQADPYAGLKPVTVKELEAWIARHVRFDVGHMAQTAPLEFGETAIAVSTAQQQPGRGRKVIQITEDYRTDDDIRKDGGERVYGTQSWKRADGTEGTSRGGAYSQKRVDSPTCDHSVLGVVAAGPGYGTTFQVCIARDRCDVHWKKEIATREKNAQLRAKGQTGKAAKRGQQEQERWQERWKRAQEEREAEEKAWRELKPRAVAAITEHVSKLKMSADLVTRVAKHYLRDKHDACTNAEQLVRVLAVHAATDRDWYREGLRESAKAFGFDVKKWSTAQQSATAAKAERPKAKPAKKAKAKR